MGQLSGHQDGLMIVTAILAAEEFDNQTGLG
jgi:hypothetical protein